MNYQKGASLCFLLILLASCGNVHDIVRQTYFIQGLMNLSVLASIKDTATPIINTIVKEELGMDKNDPYPFFLPKNDQRLSLYYVNDMDAHGESILCSVIDDYKKKITTMDLHKVTLTSHMEFFSDNGDELVLIIDDPDKELSAHNQALKTTLHQLNIDHKKKHKHDLYDVSKSERFPYLPHVGIGRLRINSIKERIKNEKEYGSTLAHIRDRIKAEITPIITTMLNDKNSIIIIPELGIFDLEKRKHIKTITL